MVDGGREGWLPASCSFLFPAAGAGFQFHGEISEGQSLVIFMTRCVNLSSQVVWLRGPGSIQTRDGAFSPGQAICPVPPRPSRVTACWSRERPRGSDSRRHQHWRQRREASLMACGGQQSRRRAEWTLRMDRALNMWPPQHRCSELTGETQEVLWSLRGWKTVVWC